MSGKIYNVVSVSGGKDSTALALLALEREPENVKFVFADTGHEHPLTVEYVQYLDGVLKERCGVGIITVKADLAEKVLHKRTIVESKWRADGVPEERVLEALEHLKPTGNPFLDMSMWKGRFPSTKARFCTTELKKNPVVNQVILPLLDEGCQAIIEWHGVRSDESLARRDLPEKDIEMGSWEPEPSGHLIYRPILKWTVEDVFAMHDKHGVKHNPLYSMGMSRVGCMPCIHARKSEVQAIAIRCGEELDRVKEWEDLVGKVSKRGGATFFGPKKVPGLPDGKYPTIDRVKEWAKTSRGGRQFDLVKWIEGEDEEGGPSCSSVYGLCE